MRQSGQDGEDADAQVGAIHFINEQAEEGRVSAMQGDSIQSKSAMDRRSQTQLSQGRTSRASRNKDHLKRDYQE